MHKPPYHERQKDHAKLDSEVKSANVSEIVQALKDVSIFAGLSEECLALFAEHAEELSLKQYERLYAEGDQGEAIFVILEGHFSMQKGDIKSPLKIANFGPKEALGEMSFIDMQPRSTTVYADAKLYRFSYLILEILRREKFKTFTFFYMNLAREISRRLRDAEDVMLKGK